VLKTEPALRLAELNKVGPDSKGWRRTEFLWVMRDGKPIVQLRDMGAREDFKAEQLQIYGGFWDEDAGRWEIIHTVEELRDMATQMRTFPIENEIEPQGSAIIEGYYDTMEMRSRLKK
jgi:hypothetical protein